MNVFLDKVKIIQGITETMVPDGPCMKKGQFITVQDMGKTYQIVIPESFQTILKKGDQVTTLIRPIEDGGANTFHEADWIEKN